MAAMTAARMVARLTGPAAGAAGGVVLAKVTSRRFSRPWRTDAVVRFDGPVLADQAGQVVGGYAGAGQAGDGVGGLVGGRQVTNRNVSLWTLAGILRH